jgi:hypothetical protein
MAEEKEDQELAAIKIILGVLGPLEAEARNNVIDYVFRRLKITAPHSQHLYNRPCRRFWRRKPSHLPPQWNHP